MSLPISKPHPSPHSLIKNQQIGGALNRGSSASLTLPTCLSAFQTLATQSLSRSQPSISAFRVHRASSRSLQQDYADVQIQFLSYTRQKLIEKVNESVVTALLVSSEQEQLHASSEQQSSHSIRQLMQAILEENLKQINRHFPQQLEEYMQEFNQAMRDTLDKKGEILQAFCGCYLGTISLLDRYFEGLNKQQLADAPSPAVYDQQVRVIEELKDLLEKSKNDLFSLLGDLKNQVNVASVQQHLQEAQEKIIQVANQIVEDFDAQWEANIVQDPRQAIDLAAKVMEFYTSTLNHYFNSLIAVVNLFVANMEGHLEALNVNLDQQVQHLVQKEKLISGFLNHEVDLILNEAMIQQKPKVSQLFGKKEGIFFDESPSRRHGFIQKIALFATHRLVMNATQCLSMTSPPSGDHFYGVQLTYGGHTSSVRGQKNDLRQDDSTYC